MDQFIEIVVMFAGGLIVGLVLRRIYVATRPKKTAKKNFTSPFS